MKNWLLSLSPRRLIFSQSSTEDVCRNDDDDASDNRDVHRNDDDDASDNRYVQWCRQVETAEPYYDGFMNEVIDLPPGDDKPILIASPIRFHTTAAAAAATTTITYVPGRIESASGDKEMLSNHEIYTQHTDPQMWHVYDIWGVIRLEGLIKAQVENLFHTQQLKEASEKNQCQFHHHPPANLDEALTPPRPSKTSQSQSTFVPSENDLSSFPSTQSHLGQTDDLPTQSDGGGNALQLDYNTVPINESNNNLPSMQSNLKAPINNMTPVKHCIKTNTIFDFGPRPCITKSIRGNNQFLNYGGARYIQHTGKLVCRRYHHPILNDHYLTRDICKQMLDRIRDNPKQFTDWLDHEDGGVKWGEHVRDRDPHRILARAPSYCPGTLIVTTASDGTQVATLSKKHTCDCRPEMNDISIATDESATIVTTSCAMIETPTEAEQPTSPDISYCHHLRSLVPPTLFHMDRLKQYLLFLDETKKWLPESGDSVQSTDTFRLNIFFDHTFLVRSVSLLVQLHPNLTQISVIVRREQTKCTASTAQEDSDDDDDDETVMSMKFCTSSITALIPVTSVQVIYGKQKSCKTLSSLLEPWQILILPPLFNVIAIPRDASVKHSYIFHLILEEADTYTGHDFAPQLEKNTRKKRARDPYLHYDGGDYQVSSAGSSYLCNIWEHPVFLNQWLTKNQQQKMLEIMNSDPLAVSKWLTQSKFMSRINEIRYWPWTINKFPNKRCPGKLRVTTQDDGKVSAFVTIPHECANPSIDDDSMQGTQ